MAAAWMMAQLQLQDTLERWVNAHAGQTFRCGLFKNDYVPVDSTVLGDLVPADFTGYVLAHFDPADFGSPTWAPYTAQVLLSVFLTYTASAMLSTPQLTYGYYVQDEDDEFRWAERWDTPFEFNASSVLNMKPALRQKTCRE